MVRLLLIAASFLVSGCGGGRDPDGTPSSALGFVNAVRDLPARTDAGGRLYVFALPR